MKSAHLVLQHSYSVHKFLRTAVGTNTPFLVRMFSRSLRRSLFWAKCTSSYCPIPSLWDYSNTSLLSIIETPFSGFVIAQFKWIYPVIDRKVFTSCAALHGALSNSNNPRPKRYFTFQFKNKVPSALFVKTVETFVVIGLPDVLSAILLNVKLKRKTVTTLWKKRYVFMTGFLRNLKHNVISFLGDKKFNFLTSSLSKRKVKYFALVVVL